MNMTLVIMAAGMGSRYGGLKQVDPVGANGEFILDYSIYDAIKAGFNKVVFIIKEENYQLFRETVGKRIEKHIQVQYVFQKMDQLPVHVVIPKDRQKPWGTAHAVYCCKDVVNENFAVINADDFYGRESFKLLADFLSCAKTDDKYHFCMAGFILANTLTENGHVARGICTSTDGAYLQSVTERTKIQKNGSFIQYFEEGTGWVTLPERCTVSMNCWGFTPEIFNEIEAELKSFFSCNETNLLKSECYLPTVVQRLIDQKKCDVKICSTSARWYGVTYHADKDILVNFIRSSAKDGSYPSPLWN